MKASYKGMDANFRYRIAEISFEEPELELYEKIEKVMKINGYALERVDNNYALCKVCDYEEYKQFVRKYREVKKSAKLWIKCGI